MSVSEAYEPIDLRDIDKYPQFYFGGFWRRFSAFFIDALIIFSPFILAANLKLGSLAVLSPDTQLGAINLAATISGLSALYFIILHFFFGATPGKKICRLRVVKMDHSRISLKDSFLRYVPYLVLSGAVIAATALYTIEEAHTAIKALFALWIIGSGVYLGRQRQRRAPHDILAGTAVIKV